jgi:hypothetical protein
MKENKIHLVSQVVIDCADNIFNPSNNAHVRDTYLMRIEAIRDYCNEVLIRASKDKDKNAFMGRDTKSKTYYSRDSQRVGKNNV